MSVDGRSALLVASLQALDPRRDKERLDRDATVAFLERTDAPFDVDAQRAHVTASAYVVSALGVILVHHLLLSIWVQPGGHVDPGETPEAAALREVKEETGVTAVHLDPPRLLAADVHDGPRGHLHYDCRWLVAALDTDLSPQEGESRQLGWFLPDDALRRCVPTLRADLQRAFDVARALGLAAVASWPS